jgi:beta-1,4-mannosyltransferase
MERPDSEKRGVKAELRSGPTSGSRVPLVQPKPLAETTPAGTPGVRRLSVAFVPYWGAGNPYQDALVEHLSALGVQVEKERSLKNLFRCGILMRGRPDIVHLHWLPAFSWREWGFLRCLAFVSRLTLLRLRGIPLIWTIHNLVPHESSHPRLDWLLARTVAALSTGLIVHGQSAKQQAIGTWRWRDRGRFAVIPHGNYMRNYPNSIDRATARERLGLKDSQIVFLFLGAVRPYKGVLELIQAFRQLATDHAVLLIAGQPLNDAFAQEIETAGADLDRVRFLPGFVPDDEIQVYMNAADAVVLPYRHLLSSGAALLAMSFGKPCVAPAMQCLTDVLDDSGAFLYDPESETGLLENMRRAVGAANTLVRMGAHNRQKASQWTWAKAAAATKALYDRCLSGTGSLGCDTMR